MVNNDEQGRRQRPSAGGGGCPPWTELALAAAADEDSSSPWWERRPPAVTVRMAGDEAGDCGLGKTRRTADIQLDDGGDDDNERVTGLTRSGLMIVGDGGMNHESASTA